MAVGTFVLVHIHGPDGEVVMRIVAVLGRYSFQEPLQVLKKQGLVFVDLDGRRGVAGEYGNAAILDHRLGHGLPNLLRDINELGGSLSFNSEAADAAFHPLAYSRNFLKFR